MNSTQGSRGQPGREDPNASGQQQQDPGSRGRSPAGGEPKGKRQGGQAAREDKTRAPRDPRDASRDAAQDDKSDEQRGWVQSDDA